MRYLKKNNRTKVIVHVLSFVVWALFAGNLVASGFEQYLKYVPTAVHIVNVDEVELDGVKYTQLDYLSLDNKINQKYVDKKTGVVHDKLPEESIALNSASRFARPIEKIFNNRNMNADRNHKVDIYLTDELKDEEPKLAPVGPGSGYSKNKARKEAKALQRFHEKRQNQFAIKVDKLVRKYKINSESIETDGFNPRRFIATVNEKTLKKLSDDVVNVDTIGIWREPIPSIVEAMAESRADTNHYNWMDGSGARVLVMEAHTGLTGGCAPAGTTAYYDNLSGVNGEHGERVVGLVGALAPNSYISCASTMLVSATYNPMNPHVINGSFGYPDHDENTFEPIEGIANEPYPLLARTYDQVTWDTRSLFVASAGNINSTAQQLSPIARGPGTLVVGSYDDDGFRAFSSAHEEFMGHQKPELSAIGVHVAIGGLPAANGTSFSAPHVTGVLAGLLGEYEEYRFRPALLKALAISGATRPVMFDIERSGYGGIDASSYHNGQQRTHAAWEVSGAWWFADFQHDNVPDNQVRFEVDVPSGQGSGRARIALALMKQPSFIWENRNAQRPIGTDVNFSVFGPNGQYLGGSYDWSDPVEVFDFDMAGPGNYRIIITNPWERDIGETEGWGHNQDDPPLKIGVAFNWDL